MNGNKDLRTIQLEMWLENAYEPWAEKQWKDWNEKTDSLENDDIKFEQPQETFEQENYDFDDEYDDGF